MTTSSIPHIHLLCLDKTFSAAFEAASKRYRLPSSVSITVHEGLALSELPSSVKFDTAVSPANSYGRLDGAFDDALSTAFSPEDDYFALTRVAQACLYGHWRGFAPPGTCTLVPIPAEFESRSRNVWGTKRIALCPTMRTPADARWDREIVYECLWSLLCTVDNHNMDVKVGKSAVSGEEPIRSVLMTPLATGVGRVTAEKWAAQAVLALKHFVDASENPEKWSAMDWQDFGKSAAEVQLTWAK